MRNFFRLMKYLKRRWRRFLLGLSIMMISTLFGGVSITMLYPIFDKLFNKPAGEIQQYDPRPLLPQIGEEFVKSFPESGELDKEYLSTVGKNLGKNFQNLLDRNSPLKVLGFLCLAFLVIVFIKSFTFFYYTLIFGALEELFSRDMRDDLFQKLSAHSLRFFDRYRSGDIISRMVSDVELLKRVVVANLANFIYSISQIIMFTAIAMVISFKLTLFALLITPSIALILGFIARKLRKYSYKSQVQIAGITNELKESVSSFKVVLAFVRQKFQFEKFARETLCYYRARVKMVKYNVMNRPVSEFLSTALGLLLLWYGGSLILQPEPGFNAAAFVVFIGAMYSMFQPLRGVFKVYAEWQKGLGVAVRYYEIFDEEPEITNPPNPVKFDGLKEGIRFDDVSFSFDGKNIILNHINLNIKNREVIALVGASGGGKTTLTNLLPRFYDPTEGRVLYDGVDLRELDLDSLRSKIGLVTQETLLFHDTVFRNIAYGLPGIDPERVCAAAKAANAHDFITALPQGYDTIIGEKGSRLSGGEKQRLAIARAILNDPEILIFDEATSALDSEAEQLIQEAMSKIIPERTVIIVAHRLSTIRHAHRILVIENGEIVEEGDHQSLMEKNGSYRRLHDLQYWLEPVNDENSK